MKAQMRKSKPLKEPSPSLGWEARQGESPLPASYYKTVKKFNELRRHRELSQVVLLAFSAKPNDAPNKINLAGDVHVRFGKAAALFPSNKIANAHPLWLLVECFQDNGVFRVRNARLLSSAGFAYTKLQTRVAAGKIVMKGFLNDKTEKFNLQEGSVLPRRINALVRAFSPTDVMTYVLSSKCAGYADVVFGQERTKVAPSSLITFQRILLGCVALLQKLRNPGIPSFLIASTIAFGFGHLAAEVASAACVKCMSSFKSSAFAPAFALQVKKTNPPKRAIAPLV